MENKQPDVANEIIDQLLELNKLVTPSQQNLSKLVYDVRAATQDNAQSFNSFYGEVANSCKTAAEKLKSFVAKLNGDLVGAQDGINVANKSSEQSKATVTRLTDQVKEAKTALEDAKNRQANERKKSRALLNEANEKLIALRYVRNIVTDELLNPPKAPGMALIQVQGITSKLEDLKKLAVKGSDAMFTTVVTSLLSMATEQNLNDQNILRKFLAALHKLEEDIKKWRTRAVAADKNIRMLNRKSNAEMLNSLRALGQLLVDARSAVMAATRTIDELKYVVDMLSKAISVKNNEAISWMNLCNDQDRIAKLFHKEQETFGKALNDANTRLLTAAANK